ncbi:MAG TPA: GFA family protein [Solirubrobacteraceae bacterium]|nr:GFA family protein [Solirubrobacteraceae bacterium]
MSLPMTGGCACGSVRFEVSSPFKTAGYCHCKRCQRRSGALWSENAVVDAGAVTVVAGAEAITRWQPPDGLPKSFCARCGGHVYSGDPGGDGVVGVRLGALDGDPGIRPQWRQWLESAPDWEPIPDDGLRRFEQSRF